ncbi:putative metal homeostasis protein [Lactobacillus selangorensis]|nr:putative metal homeostasis protein [Lactobacillus selangorensis]
MAEKNDYSSALRRLKSRNKRTKGRALKVIKELKQKRSKKRV